MASTTFDSMPVVESMAMSRWVISATVGIQTK
jgi:hypothetical protein